MAKTYNVLTIEVKEPIADIITAKQGDTNSRFLDVYLKDNGRPINLTGNEVKLYGKKQDGKVIFNNGQITDAVNGRCQFELTSQALAVAGELQLEISIWQNNERTLTTQTFKVFVVPSVRSDRAIESSNEFGALLLLFQNLNDFIQDATYIIERIGVTTDTGGTNNAGTVMAKLNNLLTNWTNARAVKIDSINDNIGKTTDTGGTNNAGTVMAKLNKLLTDWTNARAAKLDTIGETADTNGSTTTGSVMAKLNKLLTDWTNSRATKIDTINTNVSNLNTRLTSTRASRLDNIGTTTDTGGTATAGTIMAKLNKLITDGANSSSGDIGTVNNNIGTTTDTGGTTSAGTVMAKLNKLLTDWTTTRAGYITNLNSRLTSTRAGYLDKLANIGTTTDTGGTTSAGTVMAKLNKLLTDWTTTRAGYITNLNSRLTSTRAGYLDKLANIGTTTDTGGTATAGTLMAKVNALLKAGSSAGLKVKSVQHGFILAGSAKTETRLLAIATVNVAKSILITDTGGIGLQIGHSRFIAPQLIDSNHLKQYPHSNDRDSNTNTYTYYFPASNWSIVEFY